MAGTDGWGGGQVPPFGQDGQAPTGGGASRFGGPPLGGPPGGFPGAAPGSPPGGGGGSALAWSPWEAVVFGWERAKTDPGTIFGALIVGMIIASALNSVGSTAGSLDRESVGLQAVSFGLSLANLLVSSFMSGGMTLFALKVARGQRYEFGDIFKGGPYLLAILGGNILMGLGIALGILVLIVPGVILALGWCMTIPVIVDRQLGPIDAMKESWRITDGHKGQLFLFSLLLLGLMIAGLIACCVPVLAVVSVAQIAWVYVYLRLTGQSTAAIASAP